MKAKFEQANYSSSNDKENHNYTLKKWLGGSTPIFWLNPQVDMKGLLMSVKKKDYYNFVFVKVTKGMMQMAEDRVRLKLGDSMMMQMTVIFDMHDFSMKHVTHKPCKNAWGILLFSLRS